MNYRDKNPLSLRDLIKMLEEDPIFTKNALSALHREGLPSSTHNLATAVSAFIWHLIEQGLFPIYYHHRQDGRVAMEDMRQWTCRKVVLGDEDGDPMDVIRLNGWIRLITIYASSARSLPRLWTALRSPGQCSGSAKDKNSISGPGKPGQGTSAAGH